MPYEPNATWCPWNLYRTSGDVRANYASIVGNLQTTVKYATQGLSRPGCWAYPVSGLRPNRPTARPPAVAAPCAPGPPARVAPLAGHA